MLIGVCDNKINQLLRIFTILMFLIGIGSLRSFAQPEKKQLTFKGQISIEKGSGEESVLLTARGSLGDKQQQKIDASGKYSINLDFNQEYVLVFNCNGYFSKKILIDTHVPAEAYSSIEFEPSELFVSLYRKRSYIDPSFSEKPAGRVFYNAKLQRFDQESFQAEIDVRKQIQEAEKKNQRLSKEASALDKDFASEKEKQQRQLQKILDEADRNYKLKEYSKAQTVYKEALSLDPENNYCKDRIAELDYLIASQAKDAARKQSESEKVNGIIKEGDVAFSSSDYVHARQIYSTALSIQSDNETVHDRLKKVDDAIRQQGIDRTREQVKHQQAANRIEMAYDQQITSGNQFFAQSQYEEALAAFKRALGLKPGDAYAQTKINEANQKITILLAEAAKKKEAKERYAKQIASADLKFNQGGYAEARKDYEEILAISPEDTYSKSQIVRIDQIVSDHQKATETQKLYETAISEANAAYKKGDFVVAKSRYTDASRIKPEENYPQNKLMELESTLKQRAEIARLAEEEKAQKSAKAAAEKKSYQEAITKGDAAMSDKNYMVARRSYEVALTVSPQEKYPKNQIIAIDQALDAIANADKIKYQEREKALKDSITKVQSGLYAQLTGKAETAIKEARFDDAISLYTQGINVCPEKQKELEEMIDKVRRIQQERVQQADSYKSLVDGADRYFKSDQWDKALEGYRKAAIVNSSDQHVASQILLTQTKTKEYQDLMVQGDLLLKEKKFDQARVKYTQALMLHSGKEVSDKLDELAKQSKQAANEDSSMSLAGGPVVTDKNKVRAVQEKVVNYNYTQVNKPFFSYKDAIQKADSAFKAKDYTTARFYYNRALENNSEDHYAMEQVEKIKGHINGTATDEIAKEYDFLIAKGDLAVKEQKYSIAKYFYNRAMELKPQEKYPAERLVFINETTNSRVEKESDQEYHDLVKKAESALANNQLSVARYYFQQALMLKPNDEYSSKQINNIQTKITQGINNSSEQEYQNIVKKGDEAFKANQYSVARFYYLKALEIHPDDPAINEQMKKISAIQQKSSSE